MEWKRTSKNKSFFSIVSVLPKSWIFIVKKNQSKVRCTSSFDFRKQELTVCKHFLVIIVLSLILLSNTLESIFVILVSLKSTRSWWTLEFLNICSNFVLLFWWKFSFHDSCAWFNFWFWLTRYFLFNSPSILQEWNLLINVSDCSYKIHQTLFVILLVQSITLIFQMKASLFISFFQLICRYRSIHP